MLKVHIWPAFLNQSLLEWKEQNGLWTLLLTKEAHEHLQDPGRIWSKQEIDAEQVEEILALAHSIITEPTPVEGISLDGVSVSIRLSHAGTALKGEFYNPRLDSKESKFMGKLLVLAQQSFLEAECQDYLELVEPYFFECSPVKAFPGDRFRLKLIGHISSGEEQELESGMAELKSHPSPILDMSNFLGIGRMFNPLFKEIEKIPRLRVWANHQAQLYLQEIGFEGEIVVKK